MTTLNPMLVILMTVAIVVGIIFLVERHKRQEKLDKLEGVMLFGEKVTTQDYFSFCNTCIAYLLIDEKKTLDLAGFVDGERLSSPAGKESLRMIEQTINLFPIISCTLLRDAIFVVNEEKTVEKIEAYQNLTHADDYIIPLFDVGLIQRNPNIFNISTRYQQAKTVENILTTRGVGDQFDATQDIVNGLSKVAINDKKYKVPDILYSERNVQPMQ